MYEQPYDQPYPPPTVATAVIRDRRHINWRLVGAYATAALGVGVAIATLLVLFSYKSAVQTQITQMSRTIQQEHTANSNDWASLNSKYSGMVPIINSITAYDSICSQDLEGPNGPARFYFACSSNRPGN
jgi:hypothetical protein